MGIGICMVLGIFVGWLVAALEGVDEGIFVRMGLGLLGGVLGDLVATMLEGRVALTNFTWLSVFLTIFTTGLLFSGVRTRSHTEYEPGDWDQA